MDNTGNTELNYCCSCMTRLDSGQTICPVCGHDNSLRENPDSALPEGTILAGKYLVGCVLGQGGFGITYLGFDTSLDIKVAVKEYFPYGIGVRAPNSIRMTAVSSQGKVEEFRKGCDEFQAEAKRLAAIDSPYIVKVREYFRENGTAYIVMSYLEGNSLTKEAAECGGKIPWQRVVELFKPLILEMDDLHEDHLIHRDIKPDNIKVIKGKNGTEHLVLLDFGAARSFVSAEATGTYSAMVTQGYAPVEQYSRKAHQGPYTDIYALCATMYAAITGTRPPQSNDRMMGLAGLPAFSEFGLDVPKDIEKAIFHGLEVRSEDRPQSMKELYDELNGKEAAAGVDPVPAEKPTARLPKVVKAEAERKPAEKPEPPKAEKQEEVRKPSGEEKPKKKANPLLPVLLAVLLAAGFFIWRGIRQNRLNDAAAQTAEAAISTQSALELAAQLTAEAHHTKTAQAGMTQQAAAAYRETGTQAAVEALEQTRAIEAEQTAGARLRSETAAAEQTAAALERTREALERTEAAFRMRETEASFAETQLAIDIRMTGIAAAKTKAAEPTSTPTPRPVTPTPMPTNTPARNPVRVGEIITLGQYEQDNNRNNGTEAIQWLVLAVEDGRALVISRYGLDSRPYNDYSESVTWETCSLRAWLNGQFYNSAFSSAEKSRILEVRIKNPNNAAHGTKGGNDTRDRIFLLSIDEANRYFANDEARKCWPTKYTINKGAYVSEKYSGTIWWWLRSPGALDHIAAGVGTEGSIYDRGIDPVGTDDDVVRPAFWLVL